MTLTHDHLVRRAERWLLKTMGCTFVLTDHIPSLPGEKPDAIGFQTMGDRSILVEAKMSRADFLADAKKPWRQEPSRGMGAWRYYLCPPEVIQPEDLPAGWRLLWCYPNQLRRIHDPATGNIRPDFPEHDVAAEVGLIKDAMSFLQKTCGPLSEWADRHKGAETIHVLREPAD